MSLLAVSDRYFEYMPKNSNLVPTRIVNKNGVHTTVHKKPSTTSTAASRIPSPTAAAARKTNVELINDRLTKPPHISDETMLNASRSFFSEEILGELSQRLLTTGTPTGQRLAAESLSFWVGRVAERMHETGQTSIPSTPYSGNLIHGEIIRKWNYGNIREEAGLSPHSINDDDLKALKYAHSMVTAGAGSFDEFPEEAHYTMPKALEEYWRGAAALSLCFDFQDESEESDNQWQNFDFFIPWAAAHDDIGTVIDIAKKHRTLDPERLEQLIEAKNNGVHGSTVDGWL